MNIQALALAFLATITVGGVAWVFLYPMLSGERKAGHRRASVAKAEPAAARQADKNQRSRREQVEGSLKDLEARRQKESKIPLSRRLTQAGLNWTPQKFMIISGVLAAASFAIAMVAGGGSLAAVGLAFAAGFGLPRWALSFLKKRREKAFLKGLPDAVDVRLSPPMPRSRSGANSWPSSKPRRSACRLAMHASACSNGCRCRRQTSSAS